MDGAKVTVVELLGRSVKEIEQDASLDPIARAHLLAAIGHTYFGLSRFGDAVQPYEVASRMFRQSLGPDHEETLLVQINHGFVLVMLQRPDEAVRLLEGALESSKSRLGSSHRVTVKVMNRLAVAYAGVGRFADSTAMTEAVLKHGLSLSPETSEAELLVPIRVNLATGYFHEGRVKEAMSLLEETLQSARSQLGHDHPATLNCLACFAQCHQRLDRQTEAVPLWEESLRIYRDRYGDEAPYTIGAMNELANAYLRVGRPLDAVPLLEEGRRLSLNKPTAPQHTKFAILMNLSTAYQRTGRTKQAVEVSRELFELRKTSLGAGHRDPLSDMIHTADLLVAINEFQQAEALLVECRTLAIEHGHLVEKRLSIQGLVHLYDRSNQPAKAEESFRELSPELQLRFALVRQNAWPLLWGWPRF